MESSVQQELKRRTFKVRVFPNEASLERLVSAVLVEIDDKWAANAKAYIKWESHNERSWRQGVSRQQVAQSRLTTKALNFQIHREDGNEIIAVFP